jgi:predicted nucleotidyltransferase
MVLPAMPKEGRCGILCVFGSFARGDVNEGSDIDLIIFGDFSARFHKRAAAVLELTDLPVEPICYTPAEWESMIQEKNSFIVSVLQDAREL